MADELAEERAHIYKELGVDEEILFVDCEKQPGNERALAQAYNNAAEVAIDFHFDLMISMQDYLWIPNNGIEMFVEDYLNYENYLLTGLVSLSGDFSDHEIANPYDLFSIFKKPYTERPEPITWYDPREATLYPDEPMLRECSPQHWEANWAAIPVSLLKQGARWDLEYDKGIAYENMDFALRCEKEYGTKVLLDKRNHAIGIEHRKIWPEEQKQLERYTNRFFYEERWGK